MAIEQTDRRSTVPCMPNLHCQAEPVGKGLTGCDAAQLLLTVGEFIRYFFLSVIQIFSKAIFVLAEQFQNFFFP